MAAFVLLADLSYCSVRGVSTGLDPSWRNGITRASELHLVFGRDIVFTYGPLGVFLEGMKTPESFRHIFAARVAIALVFSGSVVWYCRLLSLRRFLLSVSAICFAMVCAQDRTSAVVGACVACAALILDRRSSRQPYEALIIGVFAGIGALTKFTIGVQSAGAIGSILLFGAAQELRSRSHENSNRRTLYIFVIAAIATLGAVYGGLGTLAKITVFIPFALWCCCMVALVVAIAQANRNEKISVTALALSAIPAIALFVFSGVSEFIRNGLQLSSGYSDAMMFVPADGGGREAALGALLLVLILLVAMLERPTLSFGAIVALIILGWLNFKEGYVRQDAGHIAEFLFPILFIFGLLTVTATGRRTLALSVLAFSATFYSISAIMLPASPGQAFALSRLQAPLGDFGDAFGKWPRGSDPLGGLAPDTLDAASVSKLSSLPVDIEPTESTVAFANGLAWSPEPVFQSYSAYTPALDRLDADALAKGHRRVLVDMAAIDGRDFMEESPLARRALMCDYQLDPLFGDIPVQVQGGERFVVLSSVMSNRCSSRGLRSVGTIAWDRTYAVPATAPGEMTFLALQMHYSVRGSIVKGAFRGPLVTISIHDRNGTTTTYRLLTQNATNAFLISPNPLSTADFGRLVAGTLPATTASFSIHTDDPDAFAPGIAASFEKVTFAPRERS